MLPSGATVGVDEESSSTRPPPRRLVAGSRPKIAALPATSRSRQPFGCPLGGSQPPCAIDTLHPSMKYPPEKYSPGIRSSPRSDVAHCSLRLLLLIATRYP